MCALCLRRGLLSQSHVVSQKVYGIFGWVRTILDVAKGKFVDIMAIAPRMLCGRCETAT